MRTDCKCPFVRLAAIVADLDVNLGLRVGLAIRYWELLWHLNQDPPHPPRGAQDRPQLTNDRLAAEAARLPPESVPVGGRRYIWEEKGRTRHVAASASPRTWGYPESHSPGPPLIASRAGHTVISGAVVPCAASHRAQHTVGLCTSTVVEQSPTEWRKQ